jgi:Ca2+-binding EF-hand superfamily protein
MKAFTKRQLSQVEQEEIAYAFSLFDPDDTGRILVRDVRLAMEGVGGSKALETLQRLPSDGSMNLGEFITIVSSKKDMEDEVQRVFSLFDVDNKGYIELEDLKRIARELGETMAIEELQDMMDRADPDQDGRVTAEDFTKLMAMKLFSRE